MDVGLAGDGVDPARLGGNHEFVSVLSKDKARTAEDKGR